MTNHSEVLNLAQSIAEPIPHADLTATKRRATPRRIPGLSKTSERGYLKSDRELLGGKKKSGSLYAALMLGQLRHDFEPNQQGNPSYAQRVHDGRFWVAYSLTYWEQQLDLTEHEARSGVACLASSGGVVEVGKFQFGNEPKYQHFRLTEKALGYEPATPASEGGCALNAQGVCAKHTATTPTVLAPTVLEVQETPLAETLDQQTSPSPVITGKAWIVPATSTPTPEGNPQGQTSTPKWAEPDEQTVNKSVTAWTAVKESYVAMYQGTLTQLLKQSEPKKSSVDEATKMRDSVSPHVGADEREYLRKLCGYARAAGIDARLFFDWLTPARYQGVSLDLGDDARPAALYLLGHREVYFAHYLNHVYADALTA